MRSPLLASDTLNTDASGRVKILFNDDSVVSMGPDTRLEMIEYADSGTQAAFNLHVPKGVVRAMTGKITEQNPDAFKITTPEVTIGIRGTILSLRTGGGATTVYLENTLRSVSVNGENLLTGHKISLFGGSMGQQQRISREDRRQLGRDLAMNGGPGVVAASPEPGVGGNASGQDSLTGLGSAAVLLADVGGNISAANLPLPGLDLNTIAPMGHVSMTTASYNNAPVFNTGSGTFSFDVNLRSGDITNAQFAHSGTIGPGYTGNTTFSGQPFSAAFSGGAVSGSGLQAGTINFTTSNGSVTVGGVPIADPRLSLGTFTTTPLVSAASGHAVTANWYFTGTDLLPNFQIDAGSGAGTFTK